MSKDFDLDSMREVWQKLPKGHVYSQKEIFEMIKRKSFTSVKWIFYISLIEIIMSLMVYVFFIVNNGLDSYHEHLSTQLGLGEGAFILEGIEILSVLINIYFIYQFFTAYKNIHEEATVKALTVNIINFKAVVTKFIYFNIGLGLLAMLLVVVLMGENPVLDLTTQETALMFGVVIVSLLIVLGLIGLYYYFLYGTFIRRLKKNLKSLSDIDS